MIPYEDLEKLNRPFREKFELSFKLFLDNGWYILGEQVRKFENNFATYCNAKYAIGVASGLDALYLCLKVFKFKAQSEVIVPSNTYIATILSILNANLKPVLVEPCIKTYNLDVRKIEEKINSKTVAIMPVHLYGKSCDMIEIRKIADRHNLKIIDDAAQAHGASQKSHKVGAGLADATAFSFYPTKNLGALGDGGAVVTNHKEIADELRRLRNYGSDIKYYNKIIGYNSRLDELQASFLNIKLEDLDKINNHKRKLAKIYFNNLKKDFVVPQLNEDYLDVFHIFNIRHEKRDQIKEYLLNNNVKTEIHYPVAPHKQEALSSYFADDKFPIAEEIHRTTLSLPISFCHTEQEIEAVAKLLNSF